MNTDPPRRNTLTTAPPSGAQLETVIADIREEVFARIVPKPTRSVRLGVGGALATALVILGLGTAAGTAVATGILNSDHPITGTATIALPTPDFAATDLVVTLTCLTAGEYSVSVPGIVGGEMTAQCDSDGASSSGTTEFAIDDPAIARNLIVTAPAGGSYTVDAGYIVRTAFDFPVNDNGQTFGSPVDEATNTPDLIFVVGEDRSGLPVQGYVARTDTAPPAQFPPGGWVAWLGEMQTKYPNGQPLTLYGSNGTTILGTFLLYR